MSFRITTELTTVEIENLLAKKDYSEFTQEELIDELEERDGFVLYIGKLF